MALTLGWLEVWAGVGNHEEACRTPELVMAVAGPLRLEGGRRRTWLPGGENPGDWVVLMVVGTFGGRTRLA